MTEVADNDRAYPQPVPCVGPSEAARLLPLIGSSLRSLCGGYVDYAYTALDRTKDETRIIKLLYRTSFDAPIQCTIETAGISWGLMFKALSYTRGPPSCNKILVDGKRFVVWDNLYNFLFLQSLDPNCHDTGYWIDQLCIDQDNTEERNWQAANMSDIYSCSCDGVTIWLGAGTAESDWAMERIQEQPSFPHTNIELLHDLTTTKDLKAVEHPLYGLTIISRAEYWQRLWII
jgi:hypothetical protein